MIQIGSCIALAFIYPKDSPIKQDDFSRLFVAITILTAALPAFFFFLFLLTPFEPRKFKLPVNCVLFLIKQKN
jgi:hypothetical protein